MFWKFSISSLHLSVGSNNRKITLGSAAHDPDIDFNQPRPEFEPSDVSWLKSKPALISFKEADQKQEIAERFQLLGLDMNVQEGAHGLLSIGEKVELEWFCTAVFLDKIESLMTTKLVSQQKVSLTVFTALYPLFGKTVIGVDENANARFLAGEMPAVLNGVSSYSVSIEMADTAL